MKPPTIFAPASAHDYGYYVVSRCDRMPQAAVYADILDYAELSVLAARYCRYRQH